MRTTRLVIVGAVVAAVALAGCASRKPAPVIDRMPASQAKPAAPAPAPAATPASRPDTYVVKRGDTLYSIAVENSVDWRELAAWNQISDPARISVGQTLRVKPPAAEAAAPSESGVQVNPIAVAPAIEARSLGSEPAAPQTAAKPAAAPAATPVAPVPARPATGMLKTEPKGVKLPYSEQNLAALQRSPDTAAVVPAPKPESVPPVAAKLEPAPPAAIKAEPAKPEQPPVAKAEPSKSEPAPALGGNVDGVDWGWPTNGKVVGTFAEGSSKGVEFNGRIGDPVYASAAGNVVYSGTGLPGYGKLVIIKHGEKYLSVYAHNNNLLVKEGQNVTKGQRIAEIGNSGTDRVKLHFEIRRFGKPVDPMQFLPNRAN